MDSKLLVKMLENDTKKKLEEKILEEQREKYKEKQAMIEQIRLEKRKNITLTKKQIENLRNLLMLQVGPVALLMDDEMIQYYRDRMQECIDNGIEKERFEQNEIPEEQNVQIF